MVAIAAGRTPLRPYTETGRDGGTVAEAVLGQDAALPARCGVQSVDGGGIYELRRDT